MRSLAASPHEAEVLYAGVRPAAIFRSRDGGATWKELKGFRRIRGRRLWFSPAGKPFTAYVHALAVSPSEPKVLVAGIELGAVVRSTEGGGTWSSHRPSALHDCHDFCFHASDGARVYEGGYSAPGPAPAERQGAAPVVKVRRAWARSGATRGPRSGTIAALPDSSLWPPATAALDSLVTRVTDSPA